MTKKIIITGTSGYVGKALLEHFSSLENYFIYAFQRKIPKETTKNVSYVEYHLEKELNDSDFKDIDILIHCAYKPLLSNNEEDINFSGIKKLIEKCRTHNIKIIFLSTVSAQEHITSRYAVSKMNIEKLLDIQKDVVLKLGLVIGNGGLFMKMFSFIKKIPFVPIFDNGVQKLQYISLIDVCKICSLIIDDFKVGNYVIVKNETLTMKLFYKKIANHLGKKRFFISISTSFLLRILGFTQSIGLKLPISTENLKGLKNMTSLPQHLITEITDADLRDFDESLLTFKK